MRQTSDLLRKGIPSIRGELLTGRSSWGPGKAYTVLEVDERETPSSSCCIPGKTGFHVMDRTLHYKYSMLVSRSFGTGLSKLE